MKTKVMLVICAAAIGFLAVFPARADSPADPAVIAGDALLARPLGLVATVVGSAIFVVSLPVAAASRSVHSAADALVVRPARFTFTRPLGDFDYDPDMAVTLPGSPTSRKEKSVAHSQTKRSGKQDRVHATS